MKYSVGLQPPFAFSFYWYLVGAGLVVLAFVLSSFLPRFAASRNFPGFGFRFRSPFRLDKLRRNALEQIDGIEREYNNREIDPRGVYQKMSGVLREYVQAVTGWRTQFMVCDELMKLPSPELGEFVKEYYKHEFKYHSGGNPADAVRKGRGVVYKMHDFAIMYNRAVRGYRFRMRISRKIHPILRIAPRGLKKLIINRLRRRSLKRIDSIENRLRTSGHYPYIAYTQSRLEVQNFILAVTGCEDPAMISVQLRRMNKPEQAVLAGQFFGQEYTDDILKLTATVLKGKELIEKWA